MQPMWRWIKDRAGITGSSGVIAPTNGYRQVEWGQICQSAHTQSQWLMTFAFHFSSAGKNWPKGQEDTSSKTLQHKWDLFFWGHETWISTAFCCWRRYFSLQVHECVSHTHRAKPHRQLHKGSGWTNKKTTAKELPFQPLTVPLSRGLTVHRWSLTHSWSTLHLTVMIEGLDRVYSVLPAKNPVKNPHIQQQTASDLL